MNICSYRCAVLLPSASKELATLSSTIHLVSEENRLRLLFILRQGEHCVCEIMEHVQLSQSLISHHLKDLKDAGIVIDKKRGLRVYYSLTEKGISLSDLLFQIPHGR